MQCMWRIKNDCCFQVVPLNVQMLPNAKKGLVPTLSCLLSKMLKKENSQKVGFLEAKVDRKAWDWSLTLIWGCTAGSPKVMLGREGDVYRLNKLTDSSCIKRCCCETRCWNKGEKQQKYNLQVFYLGYFILVTLLYWKPVMYHALVCTPMGFQIRKSTVPVKKLLIFFFLRKQLIYVWDYSLVSKSNFHAKPKSWGFLDHLFSSTSHQLNISSSHQLHFHY